MILRGQQFQLNIRLDNYNATLDQTVELFGRNASQTLMYNPQLNQNLPLNALAGTVTPSSGAIQVPNAKVVLNSNVGANNYFASFPLGISDPFLNAGGTTPTAALNSWVGWGEDGTLYYVPGINGSLQPSGYTRIQGTDNLPNKGSYRKIFEWSADKKFGIQNMQLNFVSNSQLNNVVSLQYRDPRSNDQQVGVFTPKTSTPVLQNNLLQVVQTFSSAANPAGWIMTNDMSIVFTLQGYTNAGITDGSNVNTVTLQLNCIMGA